MAGALLSGKSVPARSPKLRQKKYEFSSPLPRVIRSKLSRMSLVLFQKYGIAGASDEGSCFNYFRIEHLKHERPQQQWRVLRRIHAHEYPDYRRGGVYSKSRSYSIIRTLQELQGACKIFLVVVHKFGVEVMFEKKNRIWKY